jgi:hypothetical protein
MAEPTEQDREKAERMNRTLDDMRFPFNTDEEVITAARVRFYAQALADERQAALEECAKIASDTEDGYAMANGIMDADYAKGGADAARDIHAAIRAKEEVK